MGCATDPHDGQAVVWSGRRERAEHYWQQLSDFGLTMAPLSSSG